MIRTINTLPHAYMWWGLDASSTGTRLLSLSTIAGTKISNPSWVIFQSAGWVSFQSAPTATVPSGTLRLTAPFDYGVGVVVPAIADFTQRYPLCKVDAMLSDQTLDLMSSNIELAIRVGWLAETGLQARQIGSFKQLLVAPPSMAEQVAGLYRPEEITQFPFVANTALREHLRWTFTLKKNERQTVNLQASIFLDATLAVREAVRQGAGLSVLPDYTIADDLVNGRLVHVLPQWRLPSGGIHAVFPAARFRPEKVRAFVELLEDREQQRQQHSDG